MRTFVATICACLLLGAPARAVVGGSPASEEYPWMAALMTGDTQVCGATLVRPQWVLTAAHCPENEDPGKLVIVLGRHRLSATGGEEIPVDGIVMHESYNTSDIGAGHDLALLHLARPSARPLMRVVSPSEAALWAAGWPARLIGWGTYAFGLGDVHRSDDLLEVDMPMVSDEDCEASYDPGGLFDDFDPATMVCAGETTGLEGPCQGDSGGPLLVRDAAGGWTQVGVASWATGCGYPLMYGVFNRVGASPLHDWIEAHLPPLHPPAAPVAVPAPAAPAADPAVELAAPRRLRARGRTVTLRVTSTGRVTGLRAELVRNGRTLATGRLAVLESRGDVTLRARRPLRAGAHLIRLRATDSAGRPVRRSLAVRLRR